MHDGLPAGKVIKAFRFKDILDLNHLFIGIKVPDFKAQLGCPLLSLHSFDE